jgi:hypothetical protein
MLKGMEEPKKPTEYERAMMGVGAIVCFAIALLSLLIFIQIVSQ